MRKSETETTTASSSVKAEFIAAFTAAKAAQCLRFILQELESPQDSPAEICANSQAALWKINVNQAPTVETRNPDIGFPTLQDWREGQSIIMVHVAGAPNPLDDINEPFARCQAE